MRNAAVERGAEAHADPVVDLAIGGRFNLPRLGFEEDLSPGSGAGTTGVDSRNVRADRIAEGSAILVGPHAE